MKPTDTPSTKAAVWLVIAVLAAVPFHAFLTVWGSALVGHYTLLRLWDDAALAALAGICCVWLARDRDLRGWFTESLLVRLIAAYAGLTLLLGAVALLRGDVSPKALAYGLLVNLRYLVWFLVVLLTARRSDVLRHKWLAIVLAPAAVVSIFAVLQYTVLPHNFLVHFGYNTATTIAPIETINHNAHYIRVQSTLRGANPLGAYLTVAISALAVAGIVVRDKRRLAVVAVLGVVAALALYSSGSRSAWIGVVLALFVIAWFWLGPGRGRVILGVSSLAILAAGASGYLLLRNNASLQNAVLHTQNHSSVSVSSNSAHASALRSGIKDVLHQPLGDGPGTAGPASAYNTKQPARIAEDYYVQIAQETGWLGLALFLTILALVATELYGRVGGSPVALAVFAAFVGLGFVNLLSHAWADDTLAFVWWCLAGIALGRTPKGGKT